MWQEAEDSTVAAAASTPTEATDPLFHLSARTGRRRGDESSNTRRQLEHQETLNKGAPLTRTPQKQRDADVRCQTLQNKVAYSTCMSAAL